MEYIIVAVILVIAILDKQITTDPENNMLLGNPISFIVGLYISVIYQIHWSISIGTLLALNILIYKHRIRTQKG